MGMREELIELLNGKSIDTSSDTEYVADCIIAEGWIKPPCKEGDTIYRIVKFCEKNTGYKEFYRPTTEFEEDCPYLEPASWYDDSDNCTAVDKFNEGYYCTLNLKVLCEECKGRFAIQRDTFTYSKMNQIYGTSMFNEFTSPEHTYYLTLEDAEKALEEIKNE